MMIEGKLGKTIFLKRKETEREASCPFAAAGRHLEAASRHQTLVPSVSASDSEMQVYFVWKSLTLALWWRARALWVSAAFER